LLLDSHGLQVIWKTYGKLHRRRKLQRRRKLHRRRRRTTLPPCRFEVAQEAAKAEKPHVSHTNPVLSRKPVLRWEDTLLPGHRVGSTAPFCRSVGITTGHVSEAQSRRTNARKGVPKPKSTMSFESLNPPVRQSTISVCLSMKGTMTQVVDWFPDRPLEPFKQSPDAMVVSICSQLLGQLKRVQP